MDLGLSSGEPILRCHIADGAVQSHRVVVIHVDLNQAARIFQRQRGQGPDALPFERLVPAFDLSVRLRVIRRGTHVRHPRDTNELLKVPRDELRSVVGDDPRLSVRVLLLGSFQNHLDVRFLHRLPQIPMHQKTKRKRCWVQ